MSTDLYGIRILAVEPEARRVRMRVFVVYQTTPDAFDHVALPDDRSFFLRALTMTGPEWRYKWHKSPLESDIPKDRRFDEEWFNSNVWRFVERFERLEVYNDPLPDPPEKSHIRFAYERDGCWEHEDALTQADFDVWMTEERYVDHVVPGMSWGSTAYPTWSDALLAEEAPHLPDLRHLRKLQPFRGRGCPTCLAVSPDGRFLAAKSRSGRLMAWETQHWTEVFRTGAQPYQYYLDFLPASSVLIAHKGNPNSARAFDLDHNGERVEFEWPFANEKRFYPSSADGTAHAIEGQPFQIKHTDGSVQTIDDTLWGYPASLSSDGAYVAAQTHTKNVHTIHTWRVADGKKMGVLKEPRSIQSLSLSPDGRFVLVTNGYDAAVVRRVSDGAYVRIAKEYRGNFLAERSVWSPDGRFIALCMGPWTREGAGFVVIAEIGAVWEESESEGIEAVEQTPSSISIERMRQMLSPAPSGEDWQTLLDNHAQFLNSGGRGGTWEILEVAGLVLAVYKRAEGHEGKQAILRTKVLTALSSVNLAYADLSGVMADGVDASSADLSGVAATDSSFVGTCFRDAQLAGADFSRSDLRNADFTGADLTKTDFEGCDLRGANFTEARISGVCLKHAKLEGIQGFGTHVLNAKKPQSS